MIQQDERCKVTVENVTYWFYKPVLKFEGLMVYFVDKDIQEYNVKLLHRENGPAMLTTDRVIYIRNGKYHREDGPADIYIPKQVYHYYYNGAWIGSNKYMGDDVEKMTNKSFARWIKVNVKLAIYK